MTKRSAGISELESEIRELLNESTGILETRSIARFVELMLETSSSEARSYLLRVFFSIPQTEKQTFSRFIQQNGVEILGGWITEHRASFESDDRQIVYTSLSCLNKLTLTSDHLERTQITKIVSKLTQHPDSIIQTKANTLISRWKVFFSEDQKHPKYFLDPKIPQNKNLDSDPNENSIKSESVYFSTIMHEHNLNASIQSSTKKLIRWADQDNLESVKYFWRNDEPNSKCASLRPDENQDEDHPRSVSLEEFRRREVQMEKELNRKEKEKETQIENILKNMTTKINNIQLINILIPFTKRIKSSSIETQELIKNEQEVDQILYDNECEIPSSPLNVDTDDLDTEISDLDVIPFYKHGSSIKYIKVVDQVTCINDEYSKIFQALPVVSVNPYSQIMPVPVIQHSPSNILTSQVLQPPPPRIGPFPSAPIPAYNPMIQPVPVYDPTIISNPMDPYNIMNKTKMLYNPISKKPQNYRTVPCRKFHSVDGCERGDNCHFIHDFQYQGRPIPNFQDWKNSNLIRQRNIQAMNNYSVGMASYYPPPENHNNDRHS